MKVFISLARHSSREHGFAQQVRRLLQTLGIDCLMTDSDGMVARAGVSDARASEVCRSIDQALGSHGESRGCAWSEGLARDLTAGVRTILIIRHEALGAPWAGPDAPSRPHLEALRRADVWVVLPPRGRSRRARSGAPLSSYGAVHFDGLPAGLSFSKAGQAERVANPDPSVHDPILVYWSPYPEQNLHALRRALRMKDGEVVAFHARRKPGIEFRNGRIVFSEAQEIRTLATRIDVMEKNLDAEAILMDESRIHRLHPRDELGPDREGRGGALPEEGDESRWARRSRNYARMLTSKVTLPLVQSRPASVSRTTDSFSKSKTFMHLCTGDTSTAMPGMAFQFSRLLQATAHIELARRHGFIIPPPTHPLDPSALDRVPNSAEDDVVAMQQQIQWGRESLHLASQESVVVENPLATKRSRDGLGAAVGRSENAAVFAADARPGAKNLIKPGVACDGSIVSKDSEKCGSPKSILQVIAGYGASFFKAAKSSAQAQTIEGTSPDPSVDGLKVFEGLSAGDDDTGLRAPEKKRSRGARGRRLLCNPGGLPEIPLAMLYPAFSRARLRETTVEMMRGARAVRLARRDGARVTLFVLNGGDQASAPIFAPELLTWHALLGDLAHPDLRDGPFEALGRLFSAAPPPVASEFFARHEAGRVLIFDKSAAGWRLASARTGAPKDDDDPPFELHVLAPRSVASSDAPARALDDSPD
jgi:hypothetical protein